MNPHHTHARCVHADGIPSLLTPGTDYIVHSVTRGPAGRVWLRVLSDMGTTESIESDYFEGRW